MRNRTVSGWLGLVALCFGCAAAPAEHASVEPVRERRLLGGAEAAALLSDLLAAPTLPLTARLELRVAGGLCHPTRATLLGTDELVEVHHDQTRSSRVSFRDALRACQAGKVFEPVELGPGSLDEPVLTLTLVVPRADEWIGLETRCWPSDLVERPALGYVAVLLGHRP